MYSMALLAAVTIEAKASEKGFCILMHINLIRARITDPSADTNTTPWILEKGEQTGAETRTTALSLWSHAADSQETAQYFQATHLGTNKW